MTAFNPHSSPVTMPSQQESAVKAAPRVAWVTGAGGGLGQALVEAFAREGWNVAAAYHTVHSLQPSDQVWPVPLDVTVATESQQQVRQIAQRWGRIDILVNAAGAAADQVLPRLREVDWDQVIAVNLKGSFLCSQAVLPLMLRQREGQIINVTSFSARRGTVGQANYAAAKAGLIGFTESLAKELGAHNIRVNAVLPGILPTRMTAPMDPEHLQQLIGDNALKRINSLPEVARFVVFLSTLQNVSGQLFQLDSRIARWT
jgi:3-oxoacyl-[acyl-carrier protein] reductase